MPKWKVQLMPGVAAPCVQVFRACGGQPEAGIIGPHGLQQVVLVCKRGSFDKLSGRRRTNHKLIQRNLAEFRRSLVGSDDETDALREEHDGKHEPDDLRREALGPEPAHTVRTSTVKQ